MWEKKGLIFNTDNNHSWMVSFASVPTPYLVSESVIRIYLSPRNALGQSLVSYIDVNADNPSEVLYVHDQPVLDFGSLGAFDDRGVMPCSIIDVDNSLFLYYIGWNPGVSVPYRNAIGLAISEDNGATFRRMFNGPIVDRSPLEPYFTATPWVCRENNIWHLWYASATGFVTHEGKVEPLYVIKYAKSLDGISWIRENITSIHPHSEFEANARPTVILENGKWKMWFCYRGVLDYRGGKQSYRIGYAESDNAVDWKRMDSKAGIELSESGWDSEMQAYPAVFRYKTRTYMFYNGNGFGKSGVGWAEWIAE